MLFVMWPHKTTPLRGDTNLWVGAPCGLSLANKFGSHGDCDGQEEKCIMGNMDLIDSYYHWKKLSWLGKYCARKNAATPPPKKKKK